jgi:hypothetical protein
MYRRLFDSSAVEGGVEAIPGSACVAPTIWRENLSEPVQEMTKRYRLDFWTELKHKLSIDTSRLDPRKRSRFFSTTRFLMNGRSAMPTGFRPNGERKTKTRFADNASRLFVAKVDRNGAGSGVRKTTLLKAHGWSSRSSDGQHERFCGCDDRRPSGGRASDESPQAQ